MSYGMSSTAAQPGSGRWAQLIIGIICMVLIANLQYGWTLFVHPLHQAHGWSIADIQIAFSIFVALETWLTPVEGWIVDYLGAERGPKLMVAFGGILVAIGWIINADAASLGMLYFGAAISGIGAGAVYATCVGNAVKWFPDRRGLAVGLTAAGFGAGAALTVIPIRAVIARQRLCRGVLLVRAGPGGDRFRRRLADACPAGRRGPGHDPGQGRPVAPELHAAGDARDPGVLDPLRDVSAGVGQRADGDGADRPDRERLRRLQYDPVRRCDDPVAGADRRQCRQRRGAAVVRLDLRPDRPREHDGDRLRSRRHQLLAA